ncbi:MAG: ComF family protein [Clostridia bacterium]|nr:ComF family protein [Clostridia bacterium]
MSIKSIIRDLFLPPKCLGCGKRMAVSMVREESVQLCGTCKGAWQRCLLAQCPKCFAAYVDCTCQPSVLERAGSRTLIKLAPYAREQKPTPVDRVIHAMKRHPRTAAFQLCAKELSPLLQTALQKNENAEISHTVVGFLPRSCRKMRLYGFDQSRELAKRLAKTAGLECRSVLRRMHDGSEQKTLTVKERQENMKGAFRAKEPLHGLRVVLVDDVVTTGAGMAEAVRVLRRAGAAEVICVAVATTEKKHPVRNT